MDLPVMPPLRPMLAKATNAVPRGAGWLYEPKWDGFRCIVFRDGDEVELGSRHDRPFTRYFPEMLAPLRDVLPQRCVVDGELVVVQQHGLDFDALQNRIHPAESRVTLLAEQTPAWFVAFDLLALGDRDLRGEPFRERRALLEQAVAEQGEVRVRLTPLTDDAARAEDWFHRFEGAGFDGVMAKPADDAYAEGRRAQLKVKHVRTADCVAAGFRWHKDGEGIGSLLLGLYDDAGVLHHVGVASSFSAARRRELVDEVAPWRGDVWPTHPWRSWGEAEAHDGSRRMPGAPSRWSGQKVLDWEPLRADRPVEVRYEHLTNGRFRNPARFARWRDDKDARECTYAQLEEVAPAELSEVFSASDWT